LHLFGRKAFVPVRASEDQHVTVVALCAHSFSLCIVAFKSLQLRVVLPALFHVRKQLRDIRQRRA
jgi:hypothetical protein